MRPGSDPMAKLGKIMKRPFAKLSPKAIIRYFMYLPLNFIPVVGTAIFIILQGKRFGPNAHARYFQLKQMSAKQREDHIKQREAAYTRYDPSLHMQCAMLTSLLTASVSLRLYWRCCLLSASSSHLRTLLEQRCGRQTSSNAVLQRPVSETRLRKQNSRPGVVTPGALSQD